MFRNAWITGLVFSLTFAIIIPFLTSSVFAAAPAIVTNVVPTTSALAVTLTWTNPASVDFTGTMVRYSTTTFPTSISDGTLVEDVAGAVSGTSTTTLSSLTAGTIYYFSLFSHNVTPEYSVAVNAQQLVMPVQFAEDFESRTLSDINTQNGWTVVGGTWTVIDTSGEQTLQTSSDSIAYQTNRVLNGGSISTYTDQMVRADWKGSTALTPGQIFLRAQSASVDSGGYFMWQTGGTIYINYKTASGSTSVTLTSASFTPIADTWYTYEFSVVNNSAGLPVLTGYVWDRSGSKPSTPTLQATDTFNRFPQGVFSIGKTNTAITEYDNVIYSGMIGVSQANVTPGNAQNTLNWTNPTFATYSGTMVRASSSAFPTLISDGTLVSNVSGSSAGTSSASHTGLTNGTTYYYTLFPYDSSGNYGTPMHLKQIAYPALFTDDFDDLTLGTIVGQNGWTSTAGTWEVADVSSERVLNGSATTSYPTNKAINGGILTTDQILSTRFKSDNSNNTAGYIWLRYQSDGSGYLVWHNGNAWKISYMSGTLTTLATSATTAASPMEANVWFNQEVSIINNDSELPVINVYVWRDGAEKPTTPTLTVTDSSDRFVQGAFALGRNATNATYYDDVGFYGSGPALDITSPAAGVIGAPDVATISIVDTDGTIYIPFIQTSPNLSVSASAGSAPVGGGVEFVLNEGLGSEQSVIDLTSSYGTTFSGLAKGEYTLDAYIIDTDGITRLLDEESHDERTNIAIGDIITVIGDSVVAGYSGTVDGGVVTSWLDADPGTASVDNRNFPQYNFGTELYSESYLTDLNDHLSDYFGYPVFLMNEGHGGQRADNYLTTDMASADWQTRQTTLNANKWIVALGNNDANIGHSASTYQTDMTNLIDTLIGTYGAEASNIFVPYPIYDYRPCNPGCGQAADYISTYLPIIDDLRETYGMAGGPDLFNTFQNYQGTDYFDTVHPNSTGYIRMARLWEMAFMKPDLLTPEVSGRSISLTWDDLSALEPAIVGYKINYGTSTDALNTSVIVGDVTTTTINNLLWSTTYYLSVEGFDADPTDLSYTDDSDTQTAIIGAGTSTFTVGPISGNTTEAGVTATFTVVLTSQPAADVTVAVSSTDTTEGTVSVSSLTFTSGNWSTPQTVTITGVNDDVDDGNIAYTITLATAVSSDITYNGVNPSDVSSTNTDNDTAGITLTIPGDITEVTEGANTDNYTLVLTSQPVANVVIDLSFSGADITLSDASLTFTSANWDDVQTVTVTAFDDSLHEADEDVVITNTASSVDVLYDDFSVATVSVTVMDDESAPSGNSTATSTPSNLSIIINDDDACTSISEISLTLTGREVNSVLISNDSSFDDADWRSFSSDGEIISWTLDETSGVKTVYVLFRSSSGNISATLSDSITLDTISSCGTAEDETADSAEPSETEDDDSTGVTTDSHGNRIAPLTDSTGSSPFNQELQSISEVQAGWMIRSISYDAVYLVGDDGKRHAFWDAQTYFTWSDSWDDVIWVTDATLPTLSLGVPVLPKPGVVLIKIVSDPNVYSVEIDPIAEASVLRKITSEEIAVDIYGIDWADYVIDIEPTLISHYTRGLDVTTTEIVDLTVMKTRAQITALKQK